MIEEIKSLVERIELEIFGKKLNILVKYDELYTRYFVDDTADGRLYIQLEYIDECKVEGIDTSYKGRKWYLSEFMTDDEIVKTVYSAFEACVKHEVLEGFKIDGCAIFNPHTDYKALQLASKQLISRK